ncbi:MAG: VWA domain-containing protein [Chromatiales bacterium]
MFEFAWPWLALLLPLPWLLRRFLPAPAAPPAPNTDGAPVLLHPLVGRLGQTFQKATPVGVPSPLLQNLLMALLWGLLVLTLMRPQWLESHTEVVSPGYDLMLAVDTSRSMEALDFTVDGTRFNRLAVVKGVMSRFIAQRGGDRIGLIVFGDAAYLQAPLTLDGEAVRTLLDATVPRMAGDATAIGDAIGLAIKKLRDRPEGSRVLILLTDGENTAGSLPPREAARLARHYQVRIYTVGVGSKGEVPLLEDGRLKMTKMELDEELLQEIAGLTGGAYFRATDAHALEEIYARIDALEKSEVEVRSVMVPQPLYRWPLGLAMLTLLVIAALSLRQGVTGSTRGAEAP